MKVFLLKRKTGIVTQGRIWTSNPDLSYLNLSVSLTTMLPHRPDPPTTVKNGNHRLGKGYRLRHPCFSIGFELDIVTISYYPPNLKS